MATTVYLSNPALTINSVNLTDQCTSATLNYVYEQLETTAFGDTARKFGGSSVVSLQNNTFEVELYQSYAASETEATIFNEHFAEEMSNISSEHGFWENSMTNIIK